MQDCAETLLKAMRLKPPGGTFQFIPNKPGAIGHGAIGVELFLNHALLRQAAITFLAKKKSFVVGLAVEAVTSRFTKIIEDRFYEKHLDRYLQQHKKHETLLEISEANDIFEIADEMSNAFSVTTESSIWVTPFWNLEIDSELDIGDWAILRGGNLSNGGLRSRLTLPGIDGAQFPPFDFKVTTHPVSKQDSWLVVRATDRALALSKISTLLGAISMAISPDKSRLFSGVEFPEGFFWVTPKGTSTFSSRGVTIPTVFGGIKLISARIDWIGKLLVGSTQTPEFQSRILTSAEFVAAGWAPKGRLGYLHNAIAFDALFGINGSVSKSIIAGVTKHAATISDIEARIKLLIRVRNALLHGSTAAIEALDEYLEYWQKFDTDPFTDQIRILHACFQSINK